VRYSPHVCVPVSQVLGVHTTFIFDHCAVHNTAGGGRGGGGRGRSPNTLRFFTNPRVLIAKMPYTKHTKVSRIAQTDTLRCSQFRRAQEQKRYERGVLRINMVEIFVIFAILFMHTSKIGLIIFCRVVTNVVVYFRGSLDLVFTSLRKYFSRKITGNFYAGNSYSFLQLPHAHSYHTLPDKGGEGGRCANGFR